MINNETDIYGYYIDRTAKAIKSDLSARFKAVGVDLTPEQWIILNKLSKQDGQTQVELGDSTYKDAATTSRIIDLLCKKGFAERQPHDKDRRKFRIWLTDQGKATIKKAYPVVLESRNAGWGDLSKEDYDHLIRIINTVFSNLR